MEITEALKFPVIKSYILHAYLICIVLSAMSFVIFPREKWFKSFYTTVINPTIYWPMMFNIRH
jgi:hypothetical protein